MGFLNAFLRYSILPILILALSFTIHYVLLVKSQQPPLITQSPPPPPPPPVAKVIKPLTSPPPPRRRPKSESFPPPPEPRRFASSEKSKRGAINKGKTVGLVFAGLIAMLQVSVVVFLVLKRRQLLKMKDTQ